MKINKPDYYDEFFCIADKCTFSCCKHWTIAVDDETVKAWSEIRLPEGMNTSGDGAASRKGAQAHGCEAISQSGVLTDYVREESDSCNICMGEDGRCPFLREDDLCRLVLAYGEECLSETCHMFPREQHDYAGRTEFNLLPACETALRLLWARDKFTVVSEDDEVNGVDEGFVAQPKNGLDEDSVQEEEILFAIRDGLLSFAEDELLAPETALKGAFYLATELYAGNPAKLTVSYIKKFFESKDVTELKKVLSEGETGLYRERFVEDNEIFLDVIDRYREQGIYLDSIGPAAERAEYYEELLERAENAPGRTGGFGKSKDMKALASLVGSFEEYYRSLSGKMRLLLREELYATLVTPESDLRMLVMKLEWLALFFAALRMRVFYAFEMSYGASSEGTSPKSCAKEIPEAELVHLTAVLHRIMGYCDRDICEYLENSFEDEIWEWGYIDFIL